MMTLPELVTLYLSERSVSRLYERNMTRLARNVGVLTVQDCNRYLKERLTKVASVTVLYERTMLLVLWRWALDSDLVDLPPKGLVKIKSSRPPTRAWTLDQCCTAVKASFALDSEMMKSGCPLGLFIRCWLLLGYESGARRGDLWRMKASDFSGDTLWWTQHKTGNPCPKILSEECVAAVRDMLSRSPNGTVLSWATCVSGGGKQMRKFLIREKLGGSSKWLRRSSATHIEMESPGKGRIHLGHKTIGLAEKAYIDWTQVRRDIPQAPRLLKQG